MNLAVGGNSDQHRVVEVFEDLVEFGLLVAHGSLQYVTQARSSDATKRANRVPCFSSRQFHRGAGNRGGLAIRLGDTAPTEFVIAQIIRRENPVS